MSVADVVMVPFLFAAVAALVWVVFGTVRDVYMIAKWRKAMTEFDAEYWPRRHAEIEAQRQYRDIPARLDKWQREKALDELTAETERLGLYDTLTLDQALNICGIERGKA